MRITKPGGFVWLTLDGSDEEYEAEPHFVNEDGDYSYTDGKWNGMVFHPYDTQTALELVPHELSCQQAVRLEDNGGSITMLISKPFKA